MTSENTVPAYDRVTEQHWDKSVDRWETETSPLYVLVWRISASRCTLVTVWGSVVYLCQNIDWSSEEKFYKSADIGMKFYNELRITSVSHL